MLAGFWAHVKELKQRLKVIFVVLLGATAFFALFVEVILQSSTIEQSDSPIPWRQVT